MRTSQSLKNAGIRKGFDGYFEAVITHAAIMSLRSYKNSNNRRKISQTFSSYVVRHIFYLNSYAVVFRKNTSVTNIQYAELFSLIKEAVDSSAPEVGALVFHSSREFRNDIELLWQSLVCISNEFQAFCDSVDREAKHQRKTSEPTKKNKHINDQFWLAVRRIVSIYDSAYKDHCKRTVLIEPLCGSCCIGMPQHLHLDLPFIVGQAGYIDSGGRLVYCRSFPKASPKEFLDELRDAHDAITDKYSKEANGKKFAPIKFCIFSHEGFDKHEGEIDTENNQDGTESLKIFSHKNFIGSMLVSDLIGAIQNIRSGGVPIFYVLSEQAGVLKSLASYNKRYKDQYRAPCTIFLLRDQSIAENGNPGGEYYYICYAQLIRNENPFHAFEEDKPAWLSMVTTPHSLASAMINISRRAFRDGGPIRIWDPFCSTGTIPLELAKLGPGVEVVASDLMKSAAHLINDNVKIFASCACVDGARTPAVSDDTTERDSYDFSFDAVLRDLRSIDLHNCLNGSEVERQPNATAPIKVITLWAYDSVKHIVNRHVSHNLFIPDEGGVNVNLYGSLRTLREVDLLAQPEFSFITGIDENAYWLHRLILYIIWRTALTNIHEFINGDHATAEVLIKKELARKIIKLGKLADLHGSCCAGTRPAGQAKRRLNGLDCVEGAFSENVTLHPRKLAEWWTPQRVTLIAGEEGDIIKVAKRYNNYFDVIITDPPYGFNTDVELGEQQLFFYRELLRLLLLCIRDRGQLVFCLPDASINGQMVPSYLRKSWVLRELFLQVSSLFPQSGRIIELSSTKPRFGSLLFKPPYYWRSRKSLTRSILHIVVEKADFVGKVEGAENGAQQK